VIVVPYTRLHPATARLLNRHAPGHDRVRLAPGDDEAYWRLLARLWSQPGSTLIVEQDVGIRAGVVEELERCPQPWCGFPTAIGQLLLVCLGCTRFSAELKSAEPDLLDAVGRDASGGVPARVWQRLDVRVFDQLRARGYRQHEHVPAVRHYHRYPA